MVGITKTSNTDLTYSLPAGTSGMVYVCIQDTNRSSNRGSPDCLHVDRMVIRSNL